jgi:hypothetical protein
MTVTMNDKTLEIDSGSHTYFKIGEAESFTEWDHLTQTQCDQLIELQDDLKQTLKASSLQMFEILDGTADHF